MMQGRLRDPVYTVGSRQNREPYPLNSWASVMHANSAPIANELGKPSVVQSRELIAASKHFIRMAKSRVQTAAEHVEHARNVLQAVWLRRDLRRRRVRSDPISQWRNACTAKHREWQPNLGGALCG
jgi:hypothetical protein